MLKKTLGSLLTAKESDELISAFDQVGNIIIVRIPDLLLPKKKLIGETLLEQVKSAKSVFYQSSSVEGEFRTRNLEVLAGDDKTETEYKEFGCRFIVDVRKTFFSPRLSSERIRIAELVKDGEVEELECSQLLLQKRKNVPYITLISIQMLQNFARKILQ